MGVSAEDSGSREEEKVVVERCRPAPNENSPIFRPRSRMDMGLLKIKLHYFLAYGAVAGVMPYIPIFGKQLGLTATSVGIVYTVQPFFVLFSKPTIGAFTDYVKDLRAVMMLLIVLEAITYFSILQIPPLSRPLVNNLSLKCDNGTSDIDFILYNQTCLENFKNFTCDFEFSRCVGEACNSTCTSFNYRMEIWNYISQKQRSDFVNDEISEIPVDFGGLMEFPEDERNKNDSNFTSTKGFVFGDPCECGNSMWDANSCTPSSKSCLLETENDHEKTIYEAYQFWVYIFLVSASGACAAAVFTVTDTACYEILGEGRKDLYGNQRVWGTISWGIINALTGFLNQVASKGEDDIDYSPGFYLLLCLLVMDFLLLTCIKITKTNFTSTILKDVSKLLASSETLAFTVAVFLVGTLSGLLWNYQFWYLQNLGASQLLLGLTITVQCLLAEVPFFYISGYLMRNFGHFYCLVATFIAYFFRYLLYFFLINPWYVLPIELLHGQCYATFYVTITSFANTRAPPGTEATVLGIFGGMFEGLGVAVGSLLSGIGFDHLGDRNTFLVASIISAVSGAIFLIVRFVLKRTKERTAGRTTQTAAFSATNPVTVSVE